MADYYPVIGRAVGALDKKSNEARRALYDRARATLADQLQSVDPSLFERERLALEDAIRKVEAEAILCETKPGGLQTQSNDRKVGSNSQQIQPVHVLLKQLEYYLAKVKASLTRLWPANVSPSFGILVVILAALVAIGYFAASEKPNENATQEKGQQEAQNGPEKGQQEVQNESKRAALEAEQRNRCLAEQERWSIVSAPQVKISDASLTAIGNNDYNISAVVKNESESKVIGLRLSVTARDCPAQDARVSDCDIFGRVETFESDIPAGELRQINRKITVHGVAKPRHVVSPMFAVNGVRAPLNRSDDAPANDLSSGWLRGCK
jgi:hypothetical protein